jgi:hypothetical protein
MHTKFSSVNLKDRYQMEDMGKGKVVPVFFLTAHHAMKAYWRSGDVVLSILGLCTRWR